jgi:hypothetical protein
MSLGAIDNNSQCKLKESLLKIIVAQPKTTVGTVGRRGTIGDRRMGPERRETERVRISQGVEKKENKHQHIRTSTEGHGEGTLYAYSHPL